MTGSWVYVLDVVITKTEHFCLRHMVPCSPPLPTPHRRAESWRNGPPECPKEQQGFWWPSGWVGGGGGWSDGTPETKDEFAASGLDVSSSASGWWLPPHPHPPPPPPSLGWNWEMTPLTIYTHLTATIVPEYITKVPEILSEGCKQPPSLQKGLKI